MGCISVNEYIWKVVIVDIVKYQINEWQTYIGDIIENEQDSLISEYDKIA